VQWDQPAAERESHRLYPVAQVELGEHPREVGLARTLPMEQAVTISENVLSAPLHQLCFGLDPLLLLGLPVTVFGLCRAC
jgi:hypothetical protein